MSIPPQILLKVLIVDDSVVYRRILSEIVHAFPGATVAGTANDGEMALERLAESPVDLVLLDIEMPKLNGIETLQRIQKVHPRTGVIMVSGLDRNSADITIKALEGGALDFVSKPSQASPEENKEELKRKLFPILRFLSTRCELRQADTDVMKQNTPGSSSAKTGVNKPSPNPPTPNRTLPPPVKPNDTKPGVSNQKTPPPQVKQPAAPALPKIVAGPKLTQVDVIAIGVSTGGPNALTELIPQLTPKLNLPILIVQHMPPVFTASLAASLNKRSQLTVKEAEEGETVVSNTVYIAPGGKHMIVRRSATGKILIGLNDNPPENSCRPAVDVLFRSIASVYGKNVLATIMTGMGNDGALGVQALKKAGSCYCLSQSEASCVVYGMPRAVDEMGLTDEQVDLKQLANRIEQLVLKTTSR